MVDITDLAEIAEIRGQLEPLAASRAATFASESARSAMLSLASTLESLDLAASDAATLMRYDLEVHRSIYAANGNKHLEGVLVKYDNLATRIWCMVIDRLPDVSDHIAEHINLLREIASGEAEKASRTAYEHVTSFEQLVRSTI